MRTRWGLEERNRDVFKCNIFVAQKYTLFSAVNVCVCVLFFYFLVIIYKKKTAQEIN